MKRVIRNSVFETNSSSMHSIAIKRDKDKWIDKPSEDSAYDDFRFDADGVHHMPKGIEFGWGFYYLETFTEKLYYAIASYCYRYMRDYLCYKGNEEDKPDPAEAFVELEKIEKVVKEIYPKFTKIEIHSEMETFYVDQRGRGYKEYSLELGHRSPKTGEKVKPCEKLKVWDFGYIDAQSVGMLQLFLKHKNINLKDFLADPRYIIVIDTDNGPKIYDEVDNGTFKLEDFEPINGDKGKTDKKLKDYLYYDSLFMMDDDVVIVYG